MVETYIKELNKEDASGALGVLAETAIGCLSIDPQDNIYSYLARQATLLVPGSIVVLTSVNTASGMGRVEALAGLRSDDSPVVRQSLESLVGNSLPIPDYAVGGMNQDHLLSLPGGMESFCLGMLEPAAVQKLSQELDVHKAYVAGVRWKGQICGSLGIVTRNGAEITNAQAVVAFVKLLSVALHRHHLEHELLASRQYLTSLFDYAPDPYFMLDFDGTLQKVNRAAELLLGYSADELVGNSVMDMGLVAPEYISHVRRAHAQHVREGSGEPYELELLHSKGRRVYVEVRSIPLKIEGKDVLLGIARNVSERKNMESELQQTLEKLRKTLGGTIEAMARTVESRDPYTAGHQHRVADLARAIGSNMGLPADSIDALRLAGQVHDIGKIGVPVEMLSKPGRLSDMEFEIIKAHSVTGYEILKDIEFPWPIANIVLQHHERIDGTGYPNGLKGEDILIESQIIAVADVVEAMASHRPYRPALGIEMALGEIRKNRGRLYNPEIADTCLNLFDAGGYSLI